MSHIEINKRIDRFYFQCVRGENLSDLARDLSEMLLYLSNEINQKIKNNIDTKIPFYDPQDSLIRLYKIIGQTRDIYEGKGEYSLSYMMIWEWYKIFPQMAMYALYYFVHDLPINPTDKTQNLSAYGSWKDIKYMCHYILLKYDGSTEKALEDHLVKYCIDLINCQLKCDEENYLKNNTISLASKWIPREARNKLRRFNWLYEALATDYFHKYLCTVKNEYSKMRAINKCKAHYRILCSKLNKYLDTIQIKQCGGKWADIDHAKTTAITLLNQHHALLNKSTNDANVIRSVDPDRVQCAENLRIYMKKMSNEGREINGKVIGLDKYTANARHLNKRSNIGEDVDDEKTILNSQWRDNVTKNKNLGKYVAMIDVSGSNAAIALGCRIAENSNLGKRVMIFTETPQWIHLDDCDTFTSMVSCIEDKSSYTRGKLNFYEIFDLILFELEDAKYNSENVKGMILIILSDIDNTMNESDWETMYISIKERYHDAGIRVNGIPYEPPHILFWNLHNVTDYSTKQSFVGTSMISGFDPTILNLFCKSGIDELLKQHNTVLDIIMTNERYMPLELYARSIVYKNEEQEEQIHTNNVNFTMNLKNMSDVMTTHSISQTCINFIMLILIIYTFFTLNIVYIVNETE